MDGHRRQMLWPSLCLLLIAVAGADRYVRTHRGPATPANDGQVEAVAAALAGLPYRHAAWIGVDDAPPLVTPAGSAADLLLLDRTYTDIFAGGSVQVMVFYGSGPEQVRALLPRGCMEGDGWDVAAALPVALEADGQRVPGLQTTLNSTATLDDATVVVMTLAVTPAGWTEPQAAARSGTGAAVIHILARASGRDGPTAAKAQDLVPLFEPIRASLAATGDAASRSR